MDALPTQHRADPVRVGTVQDPADYRWPSCRANALGEPDALLYPNRLAIQRRRGCFPPDPAQTSMTQSPPPRLAADRPSPFGGPSAPAHHRPIRSFVLREGRLTSAQQRAFTELWPRFGADWRRGERLDLSGLFGSDHPIYLEIGFGAGDALAEMAEAHPERNYLGVEVHRPGVGHLLLQLQGRGLANVRVLRQDAVELLEHGLPSASLAGVYLFFPDPWPKKRHHKRRIVQPGFIARLARVIRPGGLFHAATDWAPYAEHMLQVLDAADGLFTNSAGPGRYASRPAGRPLTRFERRGQRLGHGVYDLIYRRR